MSMRRGLIDDEFRVVDAKKSSDNPLNLTVDKSTQTELSAFPARPILAVDVECQTTFSEHSVRRNHLFQVKLYLCFSWHLVTTVVSEITAKPHTVMI